MGGARATFVLFYITTSINLGGSVIVFVFVVTFDVFYLYRWTDIRMVSLVIIWRGSHSLAAAQLGGVHATFFLFYIAACVNLGGSVIIVIFVVVTFYVFYLYRWTNKMWWGYPSYIMCIIVCVRYVA